MESGKIKAEGKMKSERGNKNGGMKSEGKNEIRGGKLKSDGGNEIGGKIKSGEEIKS